jgi:hypothetical protein
LPWRKLVLDVRLVELSFDLKEQYLDYYLEWGEAGEKMNPGILRKMDPNRFEEMMEILLDIEIGNGERGVQESVYFLVNEKRPHFGCGHNSAFINGKNVQYRRAYRCRD